MDSEFELVTHGFELVTRRFELVTRGFELVTHVLFCMFSTSRSAEHAIQLVDPLLISFEENKFILGIFIEFTRRLLR